MTKFSPYWWEDQPKYRESNGISVNVDVVVVGAGYTGLSAAISLAKSGLEVVVFDSEEIGYGASTRNGGMMGSGHKVSPQLSEKKYGSDLAGQMHKEANASLAFTTNLIKENNIDCDFQICGRLRTSWVPQDQVSMSENLNKLRDIDYFNSKMISPDLMSESIKTDLYFGGQFYQDHGSVQPRKLHYGLFQLAINAGAKVFGNKPVKKVTRLLSAETDGFEVSVADRIVHSKNVLIATNGYTRSSLSSYLSRRILPVPSYIITTEDIGADKVKSLIPGENCIVETRKRYCYYRPTPCGKRIMIGTRAAMHSISPEKALPILQKTLAEIFPELDNVKISHCWTGFTGFSFSMLPNLGCNNGIYSAMGYCGNGVAMAPYLGHMAALKILNPNKRVTVFEDTDLQTRPYYFGSPWFLPIASAYFKVYDRFDNYRRRKYLKIMG
jgi:glycine/D-amino acid oxidase-like deaminating enzyme